MSNHAKIVAGITLLVLLVYGAFVFDAPYKEVVDDFDTCVAAGNPVMESYPRQCRDKKGNVYREVVGDTTLVSDMITVTSPARNSHVTSPLVVSGEARGMWFFEASFPLQILGADGSVLVTVPVQAEGEWMTEEFVPFKATVEFDPGKNTSGIVRFMKDNPSGLPENDARIDVPVLFETTGIVSPAGICRPTGCNGQICSDVYKDSTCEYRSEYACYKTAKCERQLNGDCGWTETPALKACLSNPPNLE